MESPGGPAASPGDTSWTEQSRALSRDPAARFRLARGHLPQRQAFREAAVALRALIREHCDSRSRVEGYLAVLYRYAALESLVYPTVDARPVDTGEGDEVEATPTERWAQVADAKVPYAEVGCEGLSLLTKTDRALMAQLWGKPKGSTTPMAWLEEQGSDADRSADGDGPEPKPEPPDDVSPQGDPEPDPVAEASEQDEEDVAADAVYRLMERERRGDESAGPAFKLRRWTRALLSRLGL